MDKKYILSILEKYYLNGLIEKVQINIKDEVVEIKFVNSNKDLVGTISAPNFKLANASLGIYDSTQLFKLIGITNAFLTLEVEQKNGISQKLLIADDSYNLEFILADTNLIPAPPKVDEPLYDATFKIDLDFITKFIKAKKSLDTDIVNIEPIFNEAKMPCIKFNIGGTKNYTNKVNFEVPANYIGLPGTSLNFKIQEIREILDANKDLKEGTGYIDQQGLFKFEFVSDDDIKSTYLLVAKEE